MRGLDVLKGSLRKMAGASTEMDSLFEGMDFVMPLENDGHFIANGGHENPVSSAVEAKEVVQEGSKPSQSPTAPALVISSHSSDPTLLSSGPADLGLSFRSVTTTIPSEPPSRSLSPTPASPSNQGEQLPRDHSEPLDESLFCGLNQAMSEDEAVMQFNLPSTNGVQQTLLTMGIPTVDSTEKISKDSIQHTRSGSLDDPSGVVRLGNDDKDSRSAEITMPVSNDGSPSLSSGKSSAGGAASLTRTYSGSTATSVVKPAMRRKKRSMKIGYGREDEENEELGLRKAGIRDVFGAALFGKDAVNSSPASSPGPVLSREISQNAVSVEESTLPSALGRDTPRLNGVGLTKENSASRLSSGSQYSTLKVDGIERLESRDVSKEIAAAQLESAVPEVIPRQSDILGNAELNSSDKDRSPGSPVEGKTSDVEIVSEPLRIAVEEIASQQVASEPASTAVDEKTLEQIASELPNIAVEVTTSERVASTPPRWDPEDTASTEEQESAPLKEHEAEAIQVYEDDMDIEPLAQPKEGTIEERLEFVKEAVSHTLGALQEKMSAVSALRKTAVQKRRRAAEKVAASVARQKELEAELDAACEREDFEKADSVSGMIGEAETSVAQAVEAFAVAEAESDSAASKVQSVLDWQVAVQEQGVTFLELLKQEAEDAAGRTLRETEEIAGRETERLEVEAKAIEQKKNKLDLELNEVEKAKEELNKAIDDLTQTESKEKSALTAKLDQLGVELQDLLTLVRMKEAEMAVCSERIADVDEKISRVAATFRSQNADLDAKLETIAIAAMKLEKDSSVISEGRQGIEQLLADAEEESCRLKNSAKLAFDTSKSMRDDVKIKKAVAVSMMLSRKTRTELAMKEKQAQTEAQLLCQNAASTRVLLQELTFSKVKLSQELGAVKERIAFAEKRAQELDAEKKLAAAARNFKVAGRLAAEAKVLNGEKETASADMARIIKELETVEGEAEVKFLAQADLDNLIAAKEREGAMAHCERLRLVAAAARDEKSFAIELEDFEEAESLDAEAKAADAEAEALQRLYELVGSDYESLDSSKSGDADSKDREAGVVECERLRLVAAAARDEMDAAAERDQFDEAETLQAKAEMADAEADKLQRLYQLEGRQFDRSTDVSEDLDVKDKESAAAD